MQYLAKLDSIDADDTIRHETCETHDSPITVPKPFDSMREMQTSLELTHLLRDERSASVSGCRIRSNQSGSRASDSCRDGGWRRTDHEPSRMQLEHKAGGSRSPICVDSIADPTGIRRLSDRSARRSVWSWLTDLVNPSTAQIDSWQHDVASVVAQFSAVGCRPGNRNRRWFVVGNRHSGPVRVLFSERWPGDDPKLDETLTAGRSL